MNYKIIFLLLFSTLCRADDGYRLWLKYDLIKDAGQRAAYARSAQFIVLNSTSPVLKTAAEELQTGLQGLLGKTVPIVPSAGGKTGGIVLASDPNLQFVNDEGYQILNRQTTITITGKTGSGVLYGTFALLRHLQTRQSIAQLSLTSSPKIQHRMLNHWGQYGCFHRTGLCRGVALEMV